MFGGEKCSVGRRPLPSRVKLIEVGTRDGFQAEDRFVPTKKKVEIINAAARSGVSAVEVTSFVHPQVIPQLADAEEVMASIDRVPGVTYSALVPNLKGAERALRCGVDEWGLMVSLSDTHSQANINVSRDEAIREAERIIVLAREEGVRINGGVLTAFGTAGEEGTDLERLFSLVDLYSQLGVRIVNVADTAGRAVPREVFRVTEELILTYPEIEFVAHFHDTCGLALENALAALEAGVTVFDCAVGGLGGCPALRNARGNLATEKFAGRLAALGIETGVDLAAVAEVKRMVSDALERG